MADQFEIDVGLETRRALDEMDVGFRKTCLEASNRVIRGTPVDQGEAKAGWQASIGAPAEGTSGQADPSGSTALAAAAGVAERVKVGDDFHLANSVPHIGVLDDGGFVPADPGPSKDPRPGRSGRILVSGGFSTQAPQGITRPAMDYLTDNFPVREAGT